jgi:hypothetical protein
MRTITIRRGMLLSVGLAATLSMAACAASKPPNSAGLGTSHTVPPAVSRTPTHAATPTRPGGVENLVISSAVRSELTAAYIADRGISLSDVSGGGPMPGSVYYAHDPAKDTYWALAGFEPSSTASLNVQVGFQDGGGSPMFRKVGAGAWHVGNPGVPSFCGEVQWFPLAVLSAWSLPTTPAPGLTC